MSRLLSNIGRFFRAAPPAPSSQLATIGNAQNARMIRARFDSQFTTDENRQHWAAADAMSIDASASWMVRRILRMRCRYEYHNNPFFIGGANRLAKFVVGTGPRLHMGLDDPAENEKVEKSFSTWAKRVRLGRKMRTSRASRFYNGEGFMLLRTNPMIRHPVKLDVFPVEADQVSSPLFGMYPASYPDQFFDGVVLDPWGNPETYHVLRQHPGAFGAFVMMGYEFDPWPARYVVHDYPEIRPGQQRGVPEAVPALDLFAELRRYRKSVLAASETAADYAMAIQSDAPADGEGAALTEPMDTFEMQRRMATVLPAGWKLTQTRAEQPVTTYDSYTTTLLVEISQTLDMPLFIFTGDARLANMSSAYVATQSFIKSVQVDRSEYENHLDDRVLPEWIAEAKMVGEIPRDVPDDPPHAWRWDRISAHADPQKMAAAQNQRLKNGTSTPDIECAMEGYDYDEVEQHAAKCYGVKPEEFRAALFQSIFAERGTPQPASLAPDTGTDQQPEGDQVEPPEDDD